MQRNVPVDVTAFGATVNALGRSVTLTRAEISLGPIDFHDAPLVAGTGRTEGRCDQDPRRISS